jgi:hypothetical protein
MHHYLEAVRPAEGGGLAPIDIGVELEIGSWFMLRCQGPFRQQSEGIGSMLLRRGRIRGDVSTV